MIDAAISVHRRSQKVSDKFSPENGRHRLSMSASTSDIV
jgi:hypothetical protein